jgi:hypothetical protein
MVLGMKLAFYGFEYALMQTETPLLLVIGIGMGSVTTDSSYLEWDL